MQDTKLNGEAADDDFSDLPEEFRAVAAQYGRALFAFTMNVGMSGQAAQVLAVLAEKHRSWHSSHAVHMLVTAFNTTASAYAERMGWDAGMLAQCDRDVLAAAEAKIIVPGSRILLQ